MVSAGQCLRGVLAMHTELAAPFPVILPIRRKELGIRSVLGSTGKC